ncbi:M15 family metallopeptidase [Alishewanella tabrizica]|uniref:Peptidase M15 n=1 Tax=Alishewanella tabrizica TaxID=671278 RepID=A0ABQ2WR24_9ALTE|nr:M15 family metallopeptidase [Alishewanella tabrizica]GGW68116.1 peptidase M15 [Alishewanella tabrizica]
MAFTPTAQFLTGQDSSSMQWIDQHHQLHQQVVPAYQRLVSAMAADGIRLKVVSSWRSFERQARIWQAKCEGRRPVYNALQQALNITQLTGLAKLEAIMLYSALPGASRHHWGTELDVYDAAAVTADYEPQLAPAEYAQGGPFHQLSCWLQEHAAQYDFFLPYQHYQGGVAAEPWHISYKPLAKECQAAFSLPMLQRILQTTPIAEQEQVLLHLPQLFERYITNIYHE